MSRKNKNGKRRNYTPKTYGRDFLTPTPIERAIQEVNKPASPQAVAVSDRIACDETISAATNTSGCPPRGWKRISAISERSTLTGWRGS